MKKQKRIKMNREQWLLLAVDALKPIFKKKCQIVLPKNIKCTMSFPLGRSAHKIAGQCLNEKISSGGKIEILINPTVDDPIKIISILAHELIHAWDGNKNGHKGPFVRVAKDFGFVSPWTQTPETPELSKELKKIVKKLPKFPHDKVNPSKREKKQTTRMIKLECDQCGFICRASHTAIIASGLPTCGCGELLSLPDLPSPEKVMLENPIKITLDGYPCKLNFEAKIDTEKAFDYGCPERTKILRQQLRANPDAWATVSHAAKDFIVEQITKRKDGSEIWHIGS